jgi:hypothetical protein
MTRGRESETAPMNPDVAGTDPEASYPVVQRRGRTPSMAQKYTGGCLCGGARFEALGVAKYVFHCHCASCRRNMGAAIATFAAFALPDFFRWTLGSPSSYESSAGVSRRFCAACGTPLSYESTLWPNEIHVSIGAFDAPETLLPQFHVYCSQQLPWLVVADSLPRFAHSDVAAEQSETARAAQVP